jgi:hypothetical protein
MDDDKEFKTSEILRINQPPPDKNSISSAYEAKSKYVAELKNKSKILVGVGDILNRSAASFKYYNKSVGPYLRQGNFEFGTFSYNERIMFTYKKQDNKLYLQVLWVNLGSYTVLQEFYFDLLRLLFLLNQTVQQDVISLNFPDANQNNQNTEFFNYLNVLKITREQKNIQVSSLPQNLKFSGSFDAPVVLDGNAPIGFTHIPTASITDDYSSHRNPNSTDQRIQQAINVYNTNPQSFQTLVDSMNIIIVALSNVTNIIAESTLSNAKNIQQKVKILLDQREELKSVKMELEKLRKEKVDYSSSQTEILQKEIQKNQKLTNDIKTDQINHVNQLNEVNTELLAVLALLT